MAIKRKGGRSGIHSMARDGGEEKSGGGNRKTG